MDLEYQAPQPTGNQQNRKMLRKKVGFLHPGISPWEVEKLKRKVKSVLKLYKETSMDEIESSKYLEVEKQEKNSARDVYVGYGA